MLLTCCVFVFSIYSNLSFSLFFPFGFVLNGRMRSDVRECGGRFEERDVHVAVVGELRGTRAPVSVHVRGRPGRARPSDFQRVQSTRHAPRVRPNHQPPDTLNKPITTPYPTIYIQYIYIYIHQPNNSLQY